MARRGWREPACGTKMRDGSDEGEIGSVSASVPLMELMTSMAGDAQSHKISTSHCLAVRMIVPSSHGMGARAHARCVRGGCDLGLSAAAFAAAHAAAAAAHASLQPL
jgi:hypothetical protein